VSKIDIDALVDKSKSLVERAILFPTFNVDAYHLSIFAHCGFFDVKKKRDYTKAGCIFPALHLFQNPVAPMCSSLFFNPLLVELCKHVHV
jgi:hypothetical protein